MNKEIWVPFIGFENLYKISNLGRAKRIVSKRCFKERFIKAYFHKKMGYLSYGLSKDNKVKRVWAHRAVFFSFNREIKDRKNMVHHVNSIKTDNRLKNLQYVTRSENCRRAVASGLWVDNRGEKCGSSVLKENDIKNIFALYRNANKTQKEIAKIYGISSSHVSNIINRKAWKHMKEIGDE